MSSVAHRKLSGMPEWNEDDDAPLLARIEHNIFDPLISMPTKTVEGVQQTLFHLGSRSRVEAKRLKKLTKTIIDSEERDQTYGSHSEWRKWAWDNILHVNGTPLHSVRPPCSLSSSPSPGLVCECLVQTTHPTSYIFPFLILSSRAQDMLQNLPSAITVALVCRLFWCQLPRGEKMRCLQRTSR